MTQRSIDPRIPFSFNKMMAELARARMEHEIPRFTYLLFGIDEKVLDWAQDKRPNKLLLVDQLLVMLLNIRKSKSLNENIDAYHEAVAVWEGLRYEVATLVGEIKDRELSEKICECLADSLALAQAVGNIEQDSSFRRKINAHKMEKARAKKPGAEQPWKPCLSLLVQKVLKRRPNATPRDIFDSLKRLDSKMFNRKNSRSVERAIKRLMNQGTASSPTRRVD